ncbi:MAG TPA: hypothetical protein VGS23_08430, partial [Thermoplasmata archaeon]|nr:hypothetical protein [Thermoplasmata archaeon]
MPAVRARSVREAGRPLAPPALFGFRSATAAALLVALLVVSVLPAWESAPPCPAPAPRGSGGTDLSAARAGSPVPAIELPARPSFGGESALTVTPHDPADFPNDGVETNITGFAPRLLGSLTSFQVGVEEVIGSYDAVFGLFQNASFGPIGFFEVFESSNDSTVHLAYGAPSATAPGVGYEFRLAETVGPVWNLTVNGAPFSVSAAAGSFDFGTASATSTSGFAFSEIAFYQGSASSVVPASLAATTALAVHEAGGWYLPHNATAGFLGGAASVWGVEGRDQVPPMAPGAVRSGTSFPAVPNGTTLWTGGPVPVDLTFALSSATTTATLPILATATVKDLNGTPIPSVPLAIVDSRGGTQLGNGNATNALGVAQLELLTPNVSAAGTDLVSVTSTILGYEARTSEALILTPAIEIDLLASPGDPTVVTNGTVVLTFRSESQGAAVPYTALEFSTTLGGRLSLAYAESGTDGSVAVSFQAGPVPATVSVQALVVEPGAWGHLVVTVKVVRPSPSLWTESEPYLVVGVAAALVALV